MKVNEKRSGRNNATQCRVLAAAASVAAVWLSMPAQAQVRPMTGAPAPFGEEPLPIDLRFGMGGGEGGVASSHNLGLVAAADNILAQQCPNGGFNWPYGGCSATFTNITAPIAMGLIRAYQATGDTSYLDAAVDGGNHDLAATWTYGGVAFSSFDPAWFQMLSDATGDPSWANIAKQDFFDRLAAGTYGDAPGSCGGNDHYPATTHDYIARHKCLRSGTTVNLRPWDMQYMPWAAGLLGNPDSAPADGIPQQDTFINDSILDGLNTLNAVDPGVTPNFFGELVGLAGGVHGLAMAGVSSFPPIAAPLYGDINGIDNTCDLADVLASKQNANGSWNWTENVSDPSDADSQTTAYALLALLAAQDLGCGPYDTEIADGRDWLWSMQDGSDGAFFSWPGGSKNIQTQGDVLMALGFGTSLSLNTSACETTGVVTVTIDMSDMPGIQIVGGQFFLEYDTSLLDFVSANVGDPPFDLEVFESVDTGAGTIDYAVGIDILSDPNAEGTSDATTMAVLTFNAPADVCADDAAHPLVRFRSHTPPTRLTDNLGNEILPGLNDLPAVEIDSTPPVITCPDDIVVNADAGSCEADVPIMPAGWEFDANASIVDTGDPAVPYAAELRSVTGDPSGPWGPTGALVWTPTTPMVFADITSLSASYNLQQGCIVGGSPRFSIGIDSDGDGDVNGHVFAHWGPEGSPWSHCPGPGWNSTGDLTASADGRWEGAQLGGGTVMTYSDVATLVNSLPESNVVYVIVALDAYWSQDQVMLVDQVQIGSTSHTFGSATATDNCDDAPTITATRDDSQPLDAPYPTGVTTITWEATDACGNTSQCQQTVTVNPNNEMLVELSLQSTVITPLERCVEFEFTDSGGNVIATASETLTFVDDGMGGNIATTTVDIPCGAYDVCMMARDPLHTLRSTGDLTIVGTQYDATGFDPLRGGDVNDDGLIDILDFGVFVWQFGEDYGTGDTDCNTPYPHADITGDSLVNGGDFTFIQINFLQVDQTCPIVMMAGSQRTSAFGHANIPLQPRESVTVRELHRMGLGHLAVADLNRDGVVDQQDIAVFLSTGSP